MNETSPQQPDPRVLLWLGWGLALFGLPLVLFGIYFAFLASDSNSWPQVEGTVSNSRVRINSSVDQTNRAFSENDSDRTYYPELTYSYTVDGQTYSSSRYALGESAPDFKEREEAQAAASAQPAGSNVNVYYDPADPSSAVLRTGASTGSWVPLLMGLFFGGAGLLILRMVSKLKPAAGRPQTAQP